ncbi:MAG: hypothetical protein ACI9R3_002670 [Verrucomicrobiales bacterium]|jgi:hypothetical protein
MRHLTVQEQMLILSVLAIVLVGACIQYYHRSKVPLPPPELHVPDAAGAVALPSVHDLVEDD